METSPPPRTLGGLLQTRAASDPDRVVFRFLDKGEGEGTPITFQELSERCWALAATLAARHEPGARALIMCPPGIDYIVAFFGCVYAGVLPVPVYPPSSMVPGRAIGRLRAVVADVGAQIAVTVSALERIVQLPGLAEVPLEWVFVDHCQEVAPQDRPTVDAVPEDIAFVQYTSGSTGNPKGVMISHGGAITNLAMIQQGFDGSQGVTGVSWLPPYHDMGLIGGILAPVWIAGTGVLMAPDAFLRRPARWLSAISRFSADWSAAPNFAYEYCTKRAGDQDLPGIDLSSWRVAINGAEPVRAGTMDRFASAFARCGFHRSALRPSYGMAETTLLISSGELGRTARVFTVDRDELQAGRLVETAAGAPAGPLGSTAELVSAGVPATGCRVIAVDPETRLPTGESEIGELWISGPQLAQGYWGRPEESEAVFRATLADGSPGVFLRSGDLGAVVDGEVVVTGRAKDVIIIRGQNYYPQDFEHSMEAADPGLRADCGVAFSVPGHPNERLVLIQGATIRADDQAALTQAAARIVTRVYEEQGVRPDAVLLVAPGHVARTSSGKVRRSTMRAAFLAGELPTRYAWRAGAWADWPTPAADIPETAGT